MHINCTEEQLCAHPKLLFIHLLLVWFLVSCTMYAMLKIASDADLHTIFNFFWFMALLHNSVIEGMKICIIRP
uniref:Uncharacterized protein n=1 Tax=Physcomitrium patens TaxID=3218 RepID=A0A2K1L1F0_PHYPA|nr:hypothetical protein PHYPA_002644 [Physcomitrium patens]